ncbi:MAG TPA: 5-formyltetrahydrofolate cyclo-ligase [bacterium]|jgi:5-formyltetrahydrofolate cyclo-ligase|nr:5-formyltetrahydrofolate cyclo-ligase [bacterium]
MDVAELRKSVLERRKAMPLSLRLELSESIGRRLLDVPLMRSPSIAQVLFFISHGSEVETGPLRRRCRALGLAVAAPRCEAGPKKLHFYGVDEPEALVPGPYGILEPAADARPADLWIPSLVLVPGSVFDRRGNRLGMGHGYYDRWLASEGRGLPTIGLAFESQLVPQVPATSLDIPVQWLVTENEIIHCASQT